MALLHPYYALCAVGFLARFSYALARTPVLPLFALYLGAGPEAIGLVVGISTVTGIFFKLPAGAASDLIGRKKTLLAGLVLARMDYLPSFWIMACALLASIPVFLWTVTHEGQAKGKDWRKAPKQKA
jgi:MFS family permease